MNALTLRRGPLTVTLVSVAALAVLLCTTKLQAQAHGGGHFGGGHSFGGAHSFGGHGFGGHGFYGGRGRWGWDIGFGFGGYYPWWGWYDPFYYPFPSYVASPGYSYSFAAPVATASPAVAPDPPPPSPAPVANFYPSAPASTTAMSSANALFGR